MLKYLLDTNVISEPLRLIPNSRIMQNLEQYSSEIALPSVVIHELFVGCYKLPPSVKRATIEKFLHAISLPVLPYDQAAAKWHAIERVRLSSLGRTPPFVDGQIAAIAFTQNLTLVTLNQADFSSYDGLKIVDWSSY
ncbi:MAG: type II toxin-antitoxin system VapC family toxin [Candidatus Obscuribacterales bacterium]